MTTYGTIPAELLPPSKLDAILKAKATIESNLGTRRPWMEMMLLQSFNLPATFNETVQRIQINASYFRYNYVIFILFTLLLCLLWHPFSLIVFIIMMASWLFLYFLREDPFVVFGIVMYDNAVVTFLLTISVMLLLLTDVSDNIIIALFIGVVVVAVHGAFRNIDDLMYNEDEEGFGSVGTLCSGGNVGTVPLKNAVSSSFSLS